MLSAYLVLIAAALGIYLAASMVAALAYRGILVGSGALSDPDVESIFTSALILIVALFYFGLLGLTG